VKLPSPREGDLRCFLFPLLLPTAGFVFRGQLYTYHTTTTRTSSPQPTRRTSNPTEATRGNTGFFDRRRTPGDIHRRPRASLQSKARRPSFSPHRTSNQNPKGPNQTPPTPLHTKPPSPTQHQPSGTTEGRKEKRRIHSTDNYSTLQRKPCAAECLWFACGGDFLFYFIFS
jgi:hypothetical protein